MTNILIKNVTKPELANPLKIILEGKTFMNLRVEVAPARGSFDVWVSTGRPKITEAELREMVTSLLSDAVCDFQGRLHQFQVGRIGPDKFMCRECHSDWYSSTGDQKDELHREGCIFRNP